MTGFPNLAASGDRKTEWHASGAPLAWIFALAPSLAFILTWSDGGFSPFQDMIRAYGLTVVGAQLVVILISVIEGVRLGPPNWRLVAPALALVVLAWVVAVRSELLLPSLFRTGIWTIQLLFALAIVNLWHHRMLDLDRFRIALLVGLLVVFAMLIAFVATTNQSADDRTTELPLFGNVRWYAYYATGGIGLAALGFVRRENASLVLGALAFALIWWTGSRGGLFAAVVGLAACTVALPAFRNARTWGRFLVCALLGLAVAYALDSIVPFVGQGPDSMARFDSTTRIEVWMATIGAIGQRPWFGWGEGQFLSIFRGETLIAQPHNVVLQVLLAWGLLGGLLCLALAAWAAPRFLGARSAEAAPFQCAALMLAAYSCIDGALYYAHSLALFFFCCAAAIATGLPRGPAGPAPEPSLLQAESER